MRRLPTDGKDGIRWFGPIGIDGHADRLIRDTADQLVQYGHNGRLNTKVIRGELWFWRHETEGERQRREESARFRAELAETKANSAWDQVQQESIRRGHERLKRQILWVEEADEMDALAYKALCARLDMEKDQ